MDALVRNSAWLVVVATALGAGAAAPLTPTSRLVHPVIEKFGGVVPLPDAVDQPRAGVKVVIDVTADSPPDAVNKGLDRAARLLNMYGAHGGQAGDVRITVVLHGEATKSALSDAAYARRFSVDRNPSLPLVRELQRAGVEVLVCGQALNYKQFDREEVMDDFPVAVAAMTVVIHRQTDGFAYLPIH